MQEKEKIRSVLFAVALSLTAAVSFLTPNFAFGGQTLSSGRRRIVATNKVPHRYQQNRFVGEIDHTAGGVSPRTHWNIGVMGGVNFSYALGAPGTTGHTLNTMSLALELERPIAEGLSIDFGMGLAQRGVNTTVYNLGSYAVNGDVHLNYLSLPVLLKQRIRLGERCNLFFLGGPMFGIATTRQVQVLGMVSLDVSDRFSWYDFAAIAGTGIEFALQRDLYFQSVLRYTYGLKDLDTTGSSPYHTRGIEVLTGIRLQY